MYFKRLSSTEVVKEVIKKNETSTCPTTMAERPEDKPVPGAQEVVPETTLQEKAKAMQEAFSDENNKDILNYIFFKKKNYFEVKKISESFEYAGAKQISNIISFLVGKGIITFNEKLPPEGRYVILPLCRIYAYLIKNGEMEEGNLRTVAGLGVKEFQALIEEALNAKIIESSVEKRVTRYAVSKL